KSGWAGQARPWRMVLKRQPDNRLQPAHRAFVERNVTAMGAGDVAGDGEAQARTALLKITALIQPVKRAEGFLAPAFGNAGSVVLDQDQRVALCPLQTHRDMARGFQA